MNLIEVILEIKYRHTQQKYVVQITEFIIISTIKHGFPGDNYTISLSC